MRIALISSNWATSPYPVYPLGMSVVAQSLKRAGHDVALMDMLMLERSIESAMGQLATLRPELVGISIRNIDNVNLLNEMRFLDVVSQLVAAIHERLKVPVVLGGSGFSILPERILETTGADYGVAGEGERLIVDLVADIAAWRSPARGTVLRSERHLKGSGIGGAYYDPGLVSYYHASGGIAAVQTKRGCSFRCSYCSYPQLEGGGIRPRPAAEVVDDIERLLAAHQAKYIFFADSVFNDAEGHFRQVLLEMQRRRLSAPWTAFIKPSGLDEDDIELMKATGLASVELGSDAACDTTLAGLQKPFNWKHVVRANNLFRARGITVAHYFMFGGPDETESTVREGIANIRDLQCTAAFVFLGIRILPHTELHARAIREGVVGPDHDLLSSVYYLSPHVSREWMERELGEAFKPLRHVLFPPDMLDDKVRLLHKLGFAGALWELLNPVPQRPAS